jgi:hypothetical protein
MDYLTGAVLLAALGALTFALKIIWVLINRNPK